MSTERALNLELVVLIVIQNLFRVGRADDECVTLVNMVYGKMSPFSRLAIRHLAVHHFHNKDNLTI